MLPVCLNDNDDVVALVVIKNPLNNKEDFVIAKWRKGQKMTKSIPLAEFPELKEYTSFIIKGFNDNGQVLLNAEKWKPNVNKLESRRLFFLNPI